MFPIAFHHSPWPVTLEHDDDAPRLEPLLAIVRVANRASKESIARQPSDEASETLIEISPEELLEKVHEVNGLIVR